jgi:short subunit fatty acids transporter
MRKRLKIGKDKKGFAITLRALAMIVLVVFGLIIAYLYFIPKASETVQSVDRHLCRTSVKAKAQTKFLKKQSMWERAMATNSLITESRKK